MTARHTLLLALRSRFVLQKRRSEPAWARAAASGLLVLAAALALMLVSVVLMGQARADWWLSALTSNLLFGLVAGGTMLLLLRASELLLPARLLDALAGMRDWRPLALVSAILLVGIALGTRLGYMLLGSVYQFDMWGKLAAAPMVQLKFFIFAALVLAGNWLWWLLQAKDKALAQQAAESQLRMLQAQIEPHFLFNTLANVQSLIRSDPQKAQSMLESFTDYLRASLGQMRDGEITLAVELETARSYLRLMQIRMGRRLQFSIEASDAARRALVPPLLLQPLVENAVRHGLEGKREGGAVHIHAQVCDGQLIVHVDDDGLGLQAAPRNARAGAGLALTNVRTRLLTRYGSAASLQLEPRTPGARASLHLPCAACPG